MESNQKIKLAVFASGGGSNAREICKYFKGNERIEIALILSNKSNAGVREVAEMFDITFVAFNKKDLYDTSYVKDRLKAHQVDYIILAGFLWLIPEYLITLYPHKIINIHPSLLPKYGGVGMYGHHIHEAVKANAELASGITIHLVNENYDDGKYLFQKSITLDPAWNAHSIASEVLKIEHLYYSRIIHKLINNSVEAE